jgi:3-hydroxyacyl-CoA dehydrogenase
MALSCTRIAASLEAKIGMPESRVGLIPAGRGTTLMRMNNTHGAKRLSEAAMTLVEGITADNADHARQVGYLRPTDVTVYHPDRLLAEARRLAVEATPVPRPQWSTPEGPLGGMIDRLVTDARGRGMTEHDQTIGQKIRTIFVRSTSYEDALARERQEFMELCSRAHTMARIRHMLETGKPLRN